MAARYPIPATSLIFYRIRSQVKTALIALLSTFAGPAAIILFGSLIAAVGVFLAAKEQRSRSNEQGEILKDLSARSGNREHLEELIRARSRALEPDRNKADDVAAAIIKRLPSLASEFEERERNEFELSDQLSTQFRLAWEPAIHSIIGRFDSLVEKCQERGLKLEIRRAIKDFPVVLAGNANARGAKGHFSPNEIRTVALGDVTLSLHYSAAEWFLPGSNHRPAIITVSIGPHEGEMLQLGFGLDEGNCRTGPPISDAEVERIKAPKDGVPPKEFLDCVEHGLANALERFLTLGSVKAAEKTEKP